MRIVLVLQLLLGSAFAEAKVHDPFLWGVANASFQVEGSPADSDWYRFTHTNHQIKDGTNADLATDFWNRYHEDFVLAKKLGANSFRMSIAWERIEPKPKQFDEAALAHYEAMIQDLRSLGLEPIITLHHYVLPAWLSERGGLLAPEFVSSYSAYAEKVITRLRQAPAKVSKWITFNEPELLVICGYYSACWPPKHFLQAQEAARAAVAIARAHITVINRIRALHFNEAKFSVAKNWAVIQPFSSSSADQEAAQEVDELFNRQFMNAFLTGKLIFRMPGIKTIQETIPLMDERPGLDFISINYYQRSLIKKTYIYPYFSLNNGPGPKTDLGWEIYPEGLYLTLKDVNQYGLPILVSENGIADRNDLHRGEFLKNHIAQMLRARSEGVQIIGYLHWSLTDNFEWALGLNPRFGLVEMNYQTLTRTPRPSYFVYQKIIKKSLGKPHLPHS